MVYSPESSRGGGMSDRRNKEGDLKNSRRKLEKIFLLLLFSHYQGIWINLRVNFGSSFSILMLEGKEWKPMKEEVSKCS